ncbi:MAG: epoxyqueuosine reductase QueH [Spirochaetes bacterium]|nr:epoxyqueuosine reductase QueH [Spirochaetota bacterium]
MRLLLHSCCAPCFGYVYELLESQYSIIPFFYNPNIAPLTEYNKRLEELKNFCGLKKVKLSIGEYDAKSWTSVVKEHRFSGERSERCWLCYEVRLRRSFEYAAANSIDMVTTTLSISPHKDAARINILGKKLSMEFGIEFLEADFKKNDGFKKSLELSKAYGFYRQNYCGCIYSKLERDKKSLWYKKCLSAGTGRVL